ncbi:hypothetical protein GCM10010339_90520 [Streptomyces alanosinicus]|uniref:Helix-turn-helix domain-containing protein n=1 Tax=Streptomyces alanosinicus TaxID=68171 RepID=A0A918YSU7_9ACTN|nr:hypothetical protein GCM10010339_90520 [Streptomyces alanosinicus]
MPSQSSETHHDPFSPERIRATWSGTASVEDAAQAFGLSRSKSYDLVRRGEFPCRVLPISRTTRVVTASRLPLLDSGQPQYNGAPVQAPIRLDQLPYERGSGCSCLTRWNTGGSRLRRRRGQP